MTETLYTNAYGQPSPLRIGLIVDSSMVSTYVHDLVVWAQGEENLTVSHLIVQELPVRPTLSGSKLARARDMIRQQGVRAFLSALVAAVIYRLEKLKLQRGDYREHLTRKDIGTLVQSTIRVTPQISASGFVYRYSAADIASITASQCDVLLRFGSGILRGEILTAAKFGVLSFHHGDNRVNRGIPAGFWEIVNKEAVTGFVIQQLTDELDGGHVLLRGAFPTQRYWLTNQAALYTRSNYYLKHLLRRIAATGALPEPEKSQPYFHPLFKYPGLSVQLCYLWNLFLYRADYFWYCRFLNKQQRWGVAFARSGWQNLAMWKAQRIENPSGRFLADPFVLSRDGRDYCFVEDFSYASRRGVISVYELLEKGATFLGNALVEPFHLSFPYLFEYAGQLYMVPETAQNDDIRLYECVSFPLEWKLKQTIMRGVSAADTMIFPHGDHWWLFTNINPLGHGDHCSELSVFYAKDPLAETWTPHAGNPILIDPTCARNGGILSDGTDIYRVSQRYGFMQYGAGSVIQRIIQLDPQHYEERAVSTIEPRFFANLLGTHHLHSNGTVSAFDFVESAIIT